MNGYENGMTESHQANTPTGIVIVAEHFNDRINPATYELFTLAHALCELVPQSAIHAVIIGDKAGCLAREMAGRTGCAVTHIKTPGSDTYNSEIYTAALLNALPRLNARYVCMAQTSQGMDCAPVLAAAMNAACITGVHDVSMADGAPCFVRTAYQGRISMTVAADRCAVVTVSPGAFAKHTETADAAGTVHTVKKENTQSRITNLEIREGRADTARLTEARTVVAAGRGIGHRENLALVERFAACFPGSVVAASRPLVDTAWMEYSRQVGLTGATVSPALYVACGVSGASQHLAGMKNSQFVAAVNRDPNAAIFNHADVCVVDDIIDFMESFIKIMEQE